MRTVRRSISTGLVMLGVLAGASLLPAAPTLALGGIEVSAPTVDSQSASALTPFGAVLEAGITTNNQVTDYHFEYSTNNTLTGATTVGGGVLSGNLETQHATPAELGGLAPATIYYYRVVATNASGTTEGAVQSFTTLPAEKPAVAAESVTATGQLRAHFAGTVNPEYQAVTACEFQYVDEATFNATGFTGTPASVPCVPSVGKIGSGHSPVSVSALGPGLQAGKAYYYRLVATNATGTTDGATERLPTALTGEASAVGPYSATIAGSVNPGSGPGPETSYYFQWGTSTIYGNQIPLSATHIANSASAVPETAELTGLHSETTYYYRIVAENGSAVAYGEGGSFTTPATPPVLTPLLVGGITQTGATITTTINSEGMPTNYELQLGVAPGTLYFQAGGTFTSLTPEPLTLNMHFLRPGIVYYYKLVAVNLQGTTESPEASFTTSPSTAVIPVIPPIPIAFPTVTHGEETSVITPSNEPEKAKKPKKKTKKKPKKKKHGHKQGKKKTKKGK